MIFSLILFDGEVKSTDRRAIDSKLKLAFGVIVSPLSSTRLMENAHVD